MDFNKYENKTPYPTTIPKSMEEKKHNREMSDVHRNEGYRLRKLFKEDAFKELGIADHPKREKVYELAWEDYHSSGYSEVFYQMEQLAKLIK